MLGCRGESLRSLTRSWNVPKTPVPRQPSSTKEEGTMGGMQIIVTFLLFLAVVLFAVAAFGVNPPKVNLGWLGLMCLALADLLRGFAH